ncbi:hypothetical protein [Lactococcus termiticola]|uniref:Uncharacterized protein n=1 Tax=Lactococcus termiticola TaxID=2169526 RepID=A0A2R5HH86_9LACT|nr:hypothetical protein [Lactococcus termiticola]GBG97216.1 hypothetical protein NtB2_01354 [Lactococcus termiticola]
MATQKEWSEFFEMMNNRPATAEELQAALVNGEFDAPASPEAPAAPQAAQAAAPVQPQAQVQAQAGPMQQQFYAQPQQAMAPGAGSLWFKDNWADLFTAIAAFLGFIALFLPAYSGYASTVSLVSTGSGIFAMILIIAVLALSIVSLFVKNTILSKVSMMLALLTSGFALGIIMPLTNAGVGKIFLLIATLAMIALPVVKSFIVKGDAA